MCFLDVDSVLLLFVTVVFLKQGGMPEASLRKANEELIVSRFPVHARGEIYTHFLMRNPHLRSKHAKFKSQKENIGKPTLRIPGSNFLLKQTLLNFLGVY